MKMTKPNIDWLAFNANFCSISAISWRENVLYINLDIYKTFRNKIFFYIKQSGYMYKKKTSI
jgi:hypothetical protein